MNISKGVETLANDEIRALLAMLAELRFKDPAAKFLFNWSVTTKHGSTQLFFFFACWRKLHLQAFNNIDFFPLAHQPHVLCNRISALPAFFWTPCSVAKRLLTVISLVAGFSKSSLRELQ